MPSDYDRIADAVELLVRSADEQPRLDEIAGAMGLGPHHFQRLFQRWAGVSPKRFVQYLTAAHAKRLLRDSSSVLDTSFAVGLSGPGRLHDLLVAVEAMSPGEFKRRGAGLRIRYGLGDTPLGTALIARTERGICTLRFPEGDAPTEIAALRAEWSGAALAEDASGSAELLGRLFDQPTGPLAVHVKGTNFQVKVWEALLRIPEGAVTSYGDLATRLGAPSAARAVAGAVAANPVAYLIPCHRVIRASGAITGYRWGPTRKRALLAREAAHTSESPTTT